MYQTKQCHITELYSIKNWRWFVCHVVSRTECEYVASVVYLLCS
jgi:hypothetical protein